MPILRFLLVISRDLSHLYCGFYHPPLLEIRTQQELAIRYFPTHSGLRASPTPRVPSWVRRIIGSCFYDYGPQACVAGPLAADRPRSLQDPNLPCLPQTHFWRGILSLSITTVTRPRAMRPNRVLRFPSATMAMDAADAAGHVPGQFTDTPLFVGDLQVPVLVATLRRRLRRHCSCFTSDAGLSLSCL